MRGRGRRFPPFRTGCRDAGPGGPSAGAGGAALVVAGLAVMMGGSVALSRWAVAHPGRTCAAQGMVRPLDGRTGTCLDAGRRPHPLLP